MRTRPGFTLVELAVVIVIVAILSTIAVSGLHQVRIEAYRAVLQSDLHALSVAQELHRTLHHSFAAEQDLAYYERSDGVIIDFAWLQSSAYAARARHQAIPGWECWYIRGQVPPGHTKPVDGATGEVLCVRE